MKPARNPLRYEQTPYEAKRWDAAESAVAGFNLAAARQFREAAEIAPDEEWKADCLRLAAVFEKREVKYEHVP
jgi:hypothetical protein